MTLDGGEPIRLGIVGVNPRYVSSGHIVFGSVDDGSVTALPFDARRLRITGAPITLLSDIVIKGGGATEIAVSRSGTLGYIEGAARNSIVRVDAPSTTIPLTLGVAQNTNWPRISPSGELLAFEAGDSRNIDIWIYNFKSRTTSRLTRDGRSQRPTWTHDGRRLAWQHVDSGKVESLWQAWDGSGRPEVLDTSGRQLLVADFSRNGDFFVSTARAGREIWLTTLATPRVTRLLTQNNRSDFAPRISPNGRWVAYTSNVSGSNEVYLTPTSETSGGSLQVTIEGGIEPVWAPDGQSIFYRNSGRVMRAVLSFTPEFIVTRRDTAFTVGLAPSGTGARYDMLPDGRSLIGVLRGDGNQRAVIVFGWLDELRERMKMAAGR
jgi:Tol biopolymer transport system component